MEILTVTGLIFLGLLLIYIEIFLLPGSFVVGILGTGSLIAGVVLSYNYFGSPIGHYSSGVVLLLFMASLVLGYKKITGKQWALQKSIDSKVNVLDESVKVGDVGRTFSDLKPSGKAIIGGKRFEVHSNGEYVDRETDIEVSKVEQNKIYVKRKNKDNG